MSNGNGNSDGGSSNSGGGSSNSGGSDNSVNSGREPRKKRSRSVVIGTLAVAAAAVVAIVLVIVFAVSGGSNDPLAAQYREGSDKGFISGDGTYTEIKPADRGDPIQFTGTIEDGKTVTSADYRGQVLVVNFWYAECAPCRAEAADLEKVSQATADSGVKFLGVNTRNQPATAASFSKTYGITYPSVVDTNSAMQLAFAGNVPPNAVPTTIVLDKEGRVAKRILGQVQDASILQTLITDTAADDTATEGK